MKSVHFHFYCQHNFLGGSFSLQDRDGSEQASDIDSKKDFSQSLSIESKKGCSSFLSPYESL